MEESESLEVLQQAVNIIHSLFTAKTEDNYESYESPDHSEAAHDAESQDLEESLKEMSEHYTLHGERRVWNRKRFRSPDNSAGEDEDEHKRDNVNRQETRKGSEPNLTLNRKLDSTRKSMVSFRDQQLALEFDQHQNSKAGDIANSNVNHRDFQLGGGMRMDTLEDPSHRSLSMKLKRSVYRSEKAVKQRDFDSSKTGHRIGEWVDVLGEQNIWRDGQVLGKEKGRLLLLYHESGAEKEEWLPDNSPRIAFFKTHTTGMENAYYLSPVPQKPVRIRLETSNGDTSMSYSKSMN